MMRMNHADAPRKRGSERPIGGTNGSEPLRSGPHPSEKRPVNLSLRCDLIAAARAARVNLSALLEHALSEELVRLKWRQWRQENDRAVAAYNRYVRENGAFCRIGLRWGCRSLPFT